MPEPRVHWSIVESERSLHGTDGYYSVTGPLGDDADHEIAACSRYEDAKMVSAALNCDDTELLDAMIEHGWRIWKISEHLYHCGHPQGLGVGSGATPREAIRAAINGLGGKARD